MKTDTLILIGGPTASGKTALSIEVARQLNVPIISADSRQFYREMSIGTAKPTAEELSEAKHYFINSHSITTLCNAGEFAASARTLIDDLLKSHPCVVVVGGSGLYLKALLEGIDTFPSVAPSIRAALKQDLEDLGLPALLDELEEKDPVYFQAVDKQNHRRIVRALEVIRASGQAYSSFLGNRETGSYHHISLAIDLPREALYDRINRRVDAMLASGLEEEVRALIPYRDHPALRTVGYQEFFDYFDGKYTYEQTVEYIKQHSRNYAKRQITWFKNQGEFRFLPREEALPYVAAKLAE